MAGNDTFSPGFANGLSQGEAARRLEEDGPNELPRSEERRAMRLLVDLVREPMVFLLIACGLVYLWLGDKQEAGMLLGFLGIILAITFYQERKSERALEALRDISSPRALVLRDGEKIRIAGREVVRGDIVFVAEGDRIPADGILNGSATFSVDESLLTGESAPVSKANGERVFAGTTAVKGTAVMTVTATGYASELGKIGGMLKEAVQAPTSLEVEIRRLVKVVAIVATMLCVLVAVVYAMSTKEWLNGLLAGLTLAMAILPNELPAVLTIFMALGAWRMSRQRILARRASAIEALGTATVLCVDKTGTLTYNRMAVRELYVNGVTYEVSSRNTAGATLPEEFHEILEYGLLAAEPEPFDPMDRAFVDAGAQMLADTEHVHSDWTIVKRFPLTPQLLALSYVWKERDGQILPIAAKGAPEAIVDLCHLPSEGREKIQVQVQLMASRGLRLLGVAKAKLPAGAIPVEQHDIDFEFVGLVGLADPIRDEVPRAVAECRSAGVRVIMITGDHPETARSIARQAGLSNPDDVLTGAELEQLNDAELALRVKTVSVCARMVPEQKSRLVMALKAAGEIVGMTGDGVNDAPALKQANIGIAMGMRGTDVAREAASIVLLDDDFSSIVSAIRMGRRIYTNLRGAMSYLLAVHIPIAGLSVLPVITGMPLILMPIHIAFLHLIIEPVCSVAFESLPASLTAMTQPPRPAHEPLLAKSVMRSTLVQGASVLGALMIVFAVAYKIEGSDLNARALAFTTLVFANLGMIVSRSSVAKDPGAKPSYWMINMPLRLAVIGSIVMLAVVLYVPPIRDLFRFAHLHAVDLAVCVVAGIVSSLWTGFKWRRASAVG